MALLSNRELMTYIESALHRSRDMLEKHGDNVAYDCLYYNFTNLFELLEAHEKERYDTQESFEVIIDSFRARDEIWEDRIWLQAMRKVLYS